MVRLDQGRLAWPDVAKGACIVLVVAHHAIAKHYLPLVPERLTDLADAWVVTTYALKPVRMPLFFVIAGMFSAGALSRPWPASSRRLATLAWLYAAWLFALAGYFAVEQRLETNRSRDLGELVADLLWPSTSLWFLWALAVYFVALKALRHLPRPLVLTVGAALCVSSSWLPLYGANRIAVVAHFVFFAAGAYAPHAFHRLADSTPRRRWLVVAAAAYVVLTLVVRWTQVPEGISLLLLAVLGVPFGVVASARVATVPILAAGLVLLGRATLPIYVLHLPVLGALMHLPVHVGDGVGPWSWAAATLYPVVATAVTVLACLGLHRLALRAGLTWAFTLPTPLVRGVGPSTGPPAKPVGVGVDP